MVLFKVYRHLGFFTAVARRFLAVETSNPSGFVSSGSLLFWLSAWFTRPPLVTYAHAECRGSRPASGSSCDGSRARPHAGNTFEACRWSEGLFIVPLARSPVPSGGVCQVSLLSVADRGHGFPSNEPPGLLEGIRLKRTSLGHAAW